MKNLACLVLLLVAAVPAIAQDKKKDDPAAKKVEAPKTTSNLAYRTRTGSS